MTNEKACASHFLVKFLVAYAETFKMFCQRKYVPVAIIMIAACCSGCTHTQLRIDHTLQAKSLTTIYEKQVLDNLAMFAQNPVAVPFFATPGAGSAVVTDNGSVSLSTLNGPGHSVIGPLGLSRGNQQSWALQPITNKAKLEEMRKLYRKAVGPDGCGGTLLINRSSKKFKPHDACEKTGSYCGCHIQICCSEGNYDAFAKLVLDILDTAENFPGPAKTREVTEFEYKNNNVTKMTKYLEIIPKSDEKSNVISPFSIEALGAPRGNPFFGEQQRQLIRGTIFPN